MTDKEALVAKLSRILNSAVSLKSGNQQAYSTACQRAIKALETELMNEETENLKQLQQALTQQEQARQAYISRREANKQNQDYLKKQIEEKTQKSKPEQPNPSPRKTVSSPSHKEKFINNIIHFQQQAFKEALDAQIKEKRELEEKKKKEELELERSHLDQAHTSLEQEVREKLKKKQEMQQMLKESWEYTKQTKNIQKNIEQLRREAMASPNFPSIRGRLNDSFDGRTSYHASRNDSREFKTNQDYSRSQSPDLRSRSVMSRKSALYDAEAKNKLDRLTREEEKLKKRKERVMKLLSSKTMNSRGVSPARKTSQKYANRSQLPKLKTLEVKKPSNFL